MGRGSRYASKNFRWYSLCFFCVSNYVQRYILPDHDSNGKAAVSWKAATMFILFLVLNPPPPSQRGGRVNAGKMTRQAKGK